jgi:glycosyltransferase involved in cell wall biosynthesis
MNGNFSLSSAMLVMESWGKGGTETYVAGLVRTLARHDIDVFLVLLQRGGEETIDFLPADRVFVSSLSELGSLLRCERPDVVNLHLYTSLLQVTLLCRVLGFRTLSTLHMPLQSWGIRHRLYWRAAIRLSTVVIGVSRLVLMQLDGKNIYNYPVPGGVEKQFFAARRDRSRSQTDKFSIIAMGRLSVEKDWPTLIEAVALLPASMRDRVSVDFYGSGNLQSELTSLASDKSVRASFHGYVDKSTLVGALSQADLSVLPSRFEGLGLSALEGMAAGVPTITADFTAAHDFIEHGATGHMFSMGNAQALSDLIVWHMEQPGESEAIAKNGRNMAKNHYSGEKTYLPYLDVIC